METFRFIKFPVYIASKELCKNVYKLTGSLKDYSLRDQIRRSALSVVLNIAEGSARDSDRQFSNFLQIALGSINELYACLEIMIEGKVISNESFISLKLQVENVAKQLGGFYKKVNC
jgi:four helix bundle protein